MRALSLLLLATLVPPTVMAQNTPEPNTPYLEFIQARASSLRAGDAPPASLDAWETQREQIRAKLLAAWGCFPTEDCPLDPRILDTLQREGYRIEKLIFQTMPDVWMTANAYVPDQQGPLPAVLSVHGHWPGAKQDPHVQARCIGLAKLGYFVLAVDAFGAGERGVGKALGEYHGDMTAATLLPVGRPLSGIQVYENQRAVDYLLTRPEVDGDRLGITGASGGGNQTMYAGAMDERFKAVVPVCSVGNYQAYLGRACCMCEVVPGFLNFAEEWGVLGLTAPRGLMVINATMDAPQFSVEAAKKSLEYVQPIYDLYEKPGHVRHATFESGHDYNQPMREAMYGWMAWHLKGEGDGSPIPEPAMTTEDPETLRCYPGDSRPDGWMTIPKFAARVGQKLVDRLHVPADPAAWQKRAAQMRKRLDQHVLGGTLPNARTRQPITPVLPEIDVEGVGKVTLLISTAESPGELEPVTRTNLEDAGQRVIPVLLRATGPNAQSNDAIGRAPDHNTAEWALWTDQPLLGQWVEDVRAAIDQLAAKGWNLDGLRLAGVGPGGVVALCAAALDDRVQQVICVGMLASYRTEVPYEGQRLGIMAPGILREVGDIQHLAALVAPRPLEIIGGVTGGGEQLDPPTLGAYYQFTRAAYHAAGAEGSLVLRPQIPLPPSAETQQ